MLTFPNAKINLGLNITSKRADGYHNIETVMFPIPSFDILEIVAAPDNKDTLHCSGRQVDCPMEKNLVYKALLAMRQKYEIPPVSIYLNKQTPDGAGLGGGSADAAFTITLLNRLFNLGSTNVEMQNIAEKIGADCPFFIYNKPTYCTGIGTTLSPIELSLPENLWIVVVKPHVSVPTKEAYSGVTPKKPTESILNILKKPIDLWQRHLVNDFEQSVFAKYPQIADIKQQLIDLGAIYASMSGSGSAVFGFFKTEPQILDVKPFGADCIYLVKKIPSQQYPE